MCCLFLVVCINLVCLLVIIEDSISFSKKERESMDDYIVKAKIEFSHFELRGERLLKTLLYSLDDDQSDYDSDTRVRKMVISIFKSYETIRGIEFFNSSKKHFKFLDIGPGEILALIKHNPEDDDVHYEKINYNNKTVNTVDEWQRNNGDLMDDKWIYDARNQAGEVITSNFHYCRILEEEVFSSSLKLNDLEAPLNILRIKISLFEALKHLANIKGVGNYLILCDEANNIVVLDDEIKDEQNFYSKTLLLTPRDEEVDVFIEQTLRKDFFPDKAFTYEVGDKRYIGKWDSVKFGNRFIKVGIVMNRDSYTGSVYYLSIISLGCCIILTILVVIYIQRIKRTKKVNQIEKKIKEADNKVIELDDENLNSVKKQVDDFILNQKMYLKTNCSLGYISDQLGIEREVISEAIKCIEDKTVKEYINDFRISAAIDYLALTEMHTKYSIDHLATQFGYNSRSTFYREFKKRTNYSPAEYIQIQA